MNDHLLNLLHCSVDLNRSDLKYDKAFTEESLKEDWSVKSGYWKTEDGKLFGESDSSGGGMIFSKAEYPHDLVMEFTASLAEPSTHDLDFMWHATWDEEKRIRNAGYVVGINGWWEQKVGFEKAPENRLYAATPLFEAKPNKEYKIIAGTVEGLCFLFINGGLIMEMRDPDPIDFTKHPFVGFETYQSRIMVWGLKIWKSYVVKRELKYTDEF
jgi:hypothetical protein